MNLETPATNYVPEPSNPTNNINGEESSSTSLFDDGYDSTCSTPYVSAPSSPGRGPVSGFFYSAPASPLHFAITAASSSPSYETDPSSSSVPMGYEFEFSARFGSSGSTGAGSMSSADELFLNGQIRPMKLSTHLERPQVLAPLMDLEEAEEEENEDKDEVAEAKVVIVRGRDLRLRDKSVRRRTRSMSPLRSNTPLEWAESEDHGPSELQQSPRDNKNNDNNCSLEIESNGRDNADGSGSGSGSGLETTPSVSGSGLGSGSSSRSSSAGRSSTRWVFLKDFLRSKSEGRSNNKFWSTITFSPTKDKKPATSTNQNNLATPVSKEKACDSNQGNVNGPCETPKSWAKRMTGKPTNGVVGKRRVPPSPHELHYKANRAQAEELRKKTFLPYRQGLLGCLGFSSKGYGAMNGFARALNPVSSR